MTLPRPRWCHQAAAGRRSFSLVSYIPVIRLQSNNFIEVYNRGPRLHRPPVQGGLSPPTTIAWKRVMSSPTTSARGHFSFDHKCKGVHFHQWKWACLLQQPVQGGASPPTNSKKGADLHRKPVQRGTSLQQLPLHARGHVSPPTIIAKGGVIIDLRGKRCIFSDHQCKGTHLNQPLVQGCQSPTTRNARIALTILCILYNEWKLPLKAWSFSSMKDIC